MIYFLWNRRRGAVKIGFSDIPKSRLNNLQSSSPDLLTLIGVCPGGRADEAELHRRFDHIRLRGEWFKDDEELLAVAEKLCEGHSVFGRCPRCGEVFQNLHEAASAPEFVCSLCDPIGPPKSLRKTRESSFPFGKIPAGGGYRIIRKAIDN